MLCIFVLSVDNFIKMTKCSAAVRPCVPHHKKTVIYLRDKILCVRCLLQACVTGLLAVISELMDEQHALHKVSLKRNIHKTRFCIGALMRTCDQRLEGSQSVLPLRAMAPNSVFPNLLIHCLQRLCRPSLLGLMSLLDLIKNIMMYISKKGAGCGISLKNLKKMKRMLTRKKTVFRMNLS